MADTAADLDELLQPGVLRAVYQPLVDLSSGVVVGYEALARGPEGSPLAAPDDMFGAARAARRLAELDWACRAAAVDGALAAGLDRPGAPWLFVNVEPEAAATPAPERFADLIQRASGLRIVMEVTERALTAHPAELLALCARVRRYGWGIAIDDVGADYALALMPLLGPDIVKLDLGVVQGEPTPELANLVHAVAAEVERTGAVLLAEGIETSSHADVAQSMGARLGQGWHLGRPGPLPDRPSPPITPPWLRPWRDRAPRASDGRDPEEGSAFLLAASDHPVQILSKRALQAMSLRLEQQAVHIGDGVVLASAFREARHLTPSAAARYTALADHAVLVAVLGRGLPAAPVPAAPAIRGGPLGSDDPLAGEWVTTVVGAHFAGAVTGRDLGDTGPDTERRFECVLTYDRERVLRVARSLLGRVAHMAFSPPESPVTEVSALPTATTGDPDADPVLGAAPAAISICDATRSGAPLSWVNDAFERLTRWSIADCRGTHAAALLVDPDAPATHAAALGELLGDGAEGCVTVPAVRRDGTAWTDERILAPVLDESGRLAWYAVIHRDVTARTEVQEAVRRWLDVGVGGAVGAPTELWRQVEGSAAALVLVQREGEVTALNSPAAALLGCRPEELIGADLISAVVPAPDRRVAWRVFHHVAEGAADARGSLETGVAAPGGARRRVAWRALRLQPAGGDASALLCILEDVTDQRAAEARIEQLRYQDETTGLANGARLRQQTTAAVARAARQRTGVAVCAIGVGGLSGLAACAPSSRDELLRGVASRLRAPVRTSDLVAHCGDGRFVVLLDEIPADAERVARRVVGDLRAALAAPFAVGDDRLFVEVAVATSVYPRDAADAEGLVERAEHAVEHSLRGRPARRA